MTQQSQTSAITADEALLHREVEALIFREARLLDAWQLEEWMTLMAPEIRYLVPPLDLPEGDPDTDLFMISDDLVRLQSRVRQLLGPLAWAETPRSRTRRLVSNVEVLSFDGGGIAAVANFAVTQYQQDKSDTFIGQYRYRFARRDGALKIAERRAVLDMLVLRPHGKISFIL